MIEIKDLALKKEIKDGIASPNEVAKYLLKNYSAWEIADALGEILSSDYQQPTKITITKEDFFAHFKIRGFKADGSIENRGKKSTIKPDDSGELNGLFEK